MQEVLLYYFLNILFIHSLIHLRESLHMHT